MNVYPFNHHEGGDAFAEFLCEFLARRRSVLDGIVQPAGSNQLGIGGRSVDINAPFSPAWLADADWGAKAQADRAEDIRLGRVWGAGSPLAGVAVWHLPGEGGRSWRAFWGADGPS